MSLGFERKPLGSHTVDLISFKENSGKQGKKASMGSSSHSVDKQPHGREKDFTEGKEAALKID